MNANNIKIIFNGLDEHLKCDSTIADLIKIKDERDINLIVEHNKRYVHSRQYSSTVLTHGDRVEFINPNFGG